MLFLQNISFPKSGGDPQGSKINFPFFQMNADFAYGEYSGHDFMRFSFYEMLTFVGQKKREEVRQILQPNIQLKYFNGRKRRKWQWQDSRPMKMAANQVGGDNAQDIIAD